MSGLASPQPEVMKHLLLRSTTPASNEKVLLYLDRMQKDPPGADDDAETVGSKVHSPIPRSRSVASGSRRLEQMAGGDRQYDGGEDFRSDIQEGNGSDIARTIPIQTTGLDEPDPDHEPGPDDPPGPRFESYGSSFGNFGPLPNGNNWNGNGTPTRAADIPLPATQLGSTTESQANPFQQFGMAPANPAGVPLPPSVMSGDPPLSPGGSKSRRTGAPSQASRRAPSAADAFSNANGVLSPKAPSRVISPPRTVNGGTPPSERPLSPRSAADSQAQKSRVTQKSSRSAHPLLPESTIENGLKSPSQRAMSPPPRTDAKTPSISPSDSASMYHARRSAPKTTSHKPSKSLKSIAEVHGESATSERAGGSRVAGSQRDARSQAPMSPRSNASRTTIPTQKSGNKDDVQRAATSLSTTRSKRSNGDAEATPTPSRPASPIADLDAEEERMINDILKRPARARTSYALSTAAPSMLEPEIQHSHFHDMELCQLLHSLDQPMAEPVKKAVRKAVRTRVKKLGMKYDNESIKQYRKSFHDHDPSVHMIHTQSTVLPGSKRSTQVGSRGDPPEWAKELMDGMINMRERLDSLAPKIERSLRSARGDSYMTEGRSYQDGHQYGESEVHGDYARSPLTQTTHILAQQTGTMGDESMYHTGDTEPIRDSTNIHTLPGSMHHHDGSAIPEEEDLYEDDDRFDRPPTTHDGDTRRLASEYNDRDESSGQQYLEEELYKLRVKPGKSSVAATHKTWELARDNGEEYYDEEGDAQAAVTESGLPEIPDAHTGQTERRGSPPLPPVPQNAHDIVGMPHAHSYQPGAFGENQLPPWQRVHQRLLSWAIVWPMAELDNALNSTTRGMQVDEVALSIWSTQTYKRYVRAKMTESPGSEADRLFVPPNMADAISTAVYNGRHGDACGMLRDLWFPFGFTNIPRLLIVLAKHRNDENHWVVHRFSLPDGSLTTYDTYPERCLPDGRPLGWWFAIRIAWPDTYYPSPDHLMQKMVRLHRPMQLSVDNSVAAAGIWRNLLMGSRAERSLDLERLRDLINTEVKNLRQRKQMGKLSIGSHRAMWDDMH